MTTNIPDHAQAIWIDPPGPPGGRTVWAAFERVVDLASPADQAAVCLFAATRYRLTVNGRVLGHGPSRYVPGDERFDTYDLSAFLRVGVNRILVEACWIASNNFQSMPGDHGRFIAWGQVRGASGETIDLSTPGGWRARPLTTRVDDVPAFSFAIGPLEVLDVAEHERQTSADADWRTPATLDDPVAPKQRDLAMPTGHILPLTPLNAATLDDGERVIGFVSAHPTARGGQGESTRGQHYRYATFIHSPTDQPITLGLHWGPHWLNGVEVAGDADPQRGNRNNAAVELRAGWNLLCGEPEQLQATSPLLIGLPRGRGLSAHAAPDCAEPRPMRYQLPRPIDPAQRWSAAPPSVAGDLEPDAATWRYVDPAAAPACPARRMSWDVRADSLAPPAAMPATLPTDRSWTAVFDRGDEYLGYVGVEIDAPAGSIVDLAYDERLRADGGVDLFACNPFVESADRFVCRAGRQRLETFHPRGGRYVQITVRRPPDAAEPITLHGLWIRDARCLVDRVGRFTCDQPLLNWTWRISAATIDASTEETFCDSPWRERGTYLGDSYVQSMTHLCLSADHRIVRRSLELFARGRRDDGQLPAAAPAWLRRPHADFSLIYPIWLHDYWARTGDRGALASGLPAVDAMLGSPRWRTADDSPLWDAPPELRLFIDWGALEAARAFDENGTLNALRIEALRCAARLHATAGEADRADRLAAEADELRRVFRRRLWLGGPGRFAGGTRGGRPIESPMLHVNILALAFGLADAEQRGPLSRYVVDRLRANAAHASRGEPADDFAELYYLKFALRALARIERFDLAEQIIGDHMAIMRDRDAWTLWECIHRGVRGVGSLCHAWSTAPLEYLSRYVLGIREVEPGNLDRVRFDPRVSTIRSAAGTIPHPRGPIRVDWQRTEEGRQQVRLTSPQTIQIDCAPGWTVTR